MKWSKLSNVQRAYLAMGAVFERDKVKHGKVIPGKAKGSQHKRFAVEDQANAKAQVTESSRAVQRDTDYQRDALNKAINLVLIAGYTSRGGAVKKLPPGRARGAGELHRKKGGCIWGR
jgi:hypothetical protein